MSKISGLFAMTLLVLAVSGLQAEADEQVVVVFHGIQGSSTFSYSPGCIEVHEYHHLMLGQGKHHEVIFTKPLDRSSVDLWEKLDQDDHISSVRFEHWRTVQGGWGKVHQVELQTVKVTAIEPHWSATDGAMVERVRLSYTQMTVTNWKQRLDGTLDPPESHSEPATVTRE